MENSSFLTCAEGISQADMFIGQFGSVREPERSRVTLVVNQKKRGG